MTYRRLQSRALWGGALLMGLLLAAPAKAEPKARAEGQGLDNASGSVKQAIDQAEKNGKMTPAVEQALEQLLQALDTEQAHRHHHRRHHDEGTFGAGFEQAGIPSTANAGSTGNSDAAGDPSIASAGSTGASDPAGDSSGGSTGSVAGTGLTGSPAAGGTGNSPNSTPSSAPLTGNKSQNKQSQVHEPPGGGHSAFAQGLRHAEREFYERREDRRERRLEHAFARGLIALSTAESGHSAKGQMGSQANNGSKTASPTPSTSTGQIASTSPKTAERPTSGLPAEGAMLHKPTEAPRQMAAGHPGDGGKGGPVATRGPTGGLVGQRIVMGHAPARPPTGSAGHAFVGQHAGALVGTKHAGHKK